MKCFNIFYHGAPELDQIKKKYRTREISVPKW